MKRFALILFAGLVLAACSSNDNETVEYNDAVGYLTNLTSAKHGIVGHWKASNSSYYYYYYNDNKMCRGPKEGPKTECVKYDIQKSSAGYFMRSYNEIGDIEGKGSYTDLTIIALTKELLKYTYEGVTYTFTKVIE